MPGDFLLAIDANSLLHRAYHAYPISLTTADGEPVNAVFGFTSMLLEVLLKLEPKYVIAAFDTKAPTFRHTLYTGYKANRPQTDSELAMQVDKAKQVLRALNIPILEYEGYEADDILGTVASQICSDKKVDRVLILTGDRDMFQLVNDCVHILIPKGSFKNLIEVDEEKVKALLGIAPEQVVDLKALMGDPSDNIPGVKGIGQKTAVWLLNNFGSLEDIFKKLDQINAQKPRIAKLLEAGHSDAIVSKRLARIKKDAPVVFDISDAQLDKFDLTSALAVFNTFQFKSLIPKLKQLAAILGVSPTETSSSKADLSAIKKTVSKKLAFLISKQAVVIGVKPEQVLEVKIKPKRLSVKEFKRFLTGGIKPADYVKFLGYYDGVNSIYLADISNLGLKIRGDFNLIFYRWWDFVNQLSDFSFIPSIKPRILDMQLLAYALSTGRKAVDFEALSVAFLSTPLAEQYQKNAADVLRVILYSLFGALEEAEEIFQFDRDVLYLAGDIDTFAVSAVALMHKNGINIDLAKVRQFMGYLEKKLTELEQQIYDTVGFEFNVRSTQQLGQVLFEHLKLPGAKKTKTGYSTDVSVLEKLLGVHPVIELLLEYRKLQKLYSTYVKPFLGFSSSGGLVNSEVVRIHSKFDPMRTSTGRLASSEPNLQNLPVRTEEGRKIREFFVPADGHVFVSFDYSQIDLRVLAHLSEDENLVSAFKQGRDIHRETASRIFKKPYDKINKRERRIAKTINFGLVYGMSFHGLATTLGLEHTEAKQFIEEYFKHFPGVLRYIEATKEFVSKHHFVISLLGRRRYIHGILSNNKVRRNAAFREAINMPIQGGSDDILRSAMAKIVKQEDVASAKVKLVLQVHDELVFEVPENKKTVDEFVSRIKDLMENVVKLRVPLKVEATIEHSLGEK